MTRGGFHCPDCRSERREYAYYPNPRYPDDGDGCFLRRSVARRSRRSLEQGARRHRLEHWDGEAHGYVEPTNAFYFKALCWMNSLRELSGPVLHRLGEACHAATLKSDPETASRHARKARVLLVTLSRAFLGDPYLASLLEISESDLQERLADFYGDGNPENPTPATASTPVRSYRGDPERPLNAPGDRIRHQRRFNLPWRVELESQFGAGFYGRYSMVAETFDEAESDLKAAALRILTSVEGDSLKLQASGGMLKRGILEYTLHPYALVTGADQSLDLYPDAQAATWPHCGRRPDHRKRGQRHTSTFFITSLPATVWARRARPPTPIGESQA